MNRKNTIVAIATSVGKSSIGIVRVSGPDVLLVAKKILKTKLVERYAHFLPFFDNKNNIIDQGIVLLFLSPRSYTGEDILEFHGHGNLIVLNLLIKNILLIKNVRIAEPGEFSKRAFFNKKIDLIQAESICDLINADTESKVKSSLQSLTGDFSKYIRKIVKKINDITIILEATINFSDEVPEEKNFFKKIDNNLTQLIYLLHQVTKISKQGCLLREGIKIILIGPSNAGKSSLFNRLLHKKVSIVTEIEGTTRDILKENICINFFNIQLIDTAGLRHNPGKIEKIGIQLAVKEIKICDYIFLILDSTIKKEKHLYYIQKIAQKLQNFQKLIIIFNKIDLLNFKILLKDYPSKYLYFFISLKTDIGVKKIFKFLNNLSKKDNNLESTFLARQRHLELLKLSLKFIEEGKHEWNNLYSFECLLDNLRLAKKYLFQVTGKFSHNDLLEKIFSKFCIGK
ncbi:tRNA uridine-5-carboxymethylaminomethyl(34) synthesis GTPase MnmE [Buchnera aphidicola]|uniref:tRNA modification GTPase MnmE n=1 Tax=Buchnera aphidicola subsp. Tuberolachnus salignus TaxID=98804 RepID=A0A160SWI1_BUCTT|nr:tRNA uridine-5-carboxymethylaminomethyl(34) synthesis GTPase MnmE [Buchnera aphidicola]CUR53000.1 tRNA modification GTPase MnmE [Buchnera aphidicola (Tuberolachnus salignus)]